MPPLSRCTAKCVKVRYSSLIVCAVCSRQTLLRMSKSIIEDNLPLVTKMQSDGALAIHKLHIPDFGRCLDLQQRPSY